MPEKLINAIVWGQTREPEDDPRTTITVWWYWNPKGFCEGTEVAVEPIPPANKKGKTVKRPTVSRALASLAGKAKGLPPDAAQMLTTISTGTLNDELASRRYVVLRGLSRQAGFTVLLKYGAPLSPGSGPILALDNPDPRAHITVHEYKAPLQTQAAPRRPASRRRRPAALAAHGRPLG